MTQHPVRVRFSDLGVCAYTEAWELQKSVHESLVRAKTGNESDPALPCLFFVEHPHVYTLGKSGHENNLLISAERLARLGATFVKTDRGGDITYHGPGQLVGYPVLDLDALGIGVRRYISILEESVIRLLAHYGIEAGRSEGATGVWLSAVGQKQARKICAIGVKVSRAVTMHGFALNVQPDLNYFGYINPCGFTETGVTSMSQELGRQMQIGEVKPALMQILAEELGIAYLNEKKPG